MEKVIVTEGAVDKLLLERVLQSVQEHHPGLLPALPRMAVGEGYSSALSIIVTLLASNQYQVLAWLDADTEEPAAVREKEQFIRAYLGGMAQDDNLQLVLVQPTLEKFVQRHTARQWKSGQESKQGFINHLNDQDLVRIGQTSEVDQLLRFLQPAA